MKFTVQMTTDNEAFDGNMAPETARILREIAGRIERDGVDEEQGGTFTTIHDANGNDVGRWAFTPDWYK